MTGSINWVYNLHVELVAAGNESRCKMLFSFSLSNGSTVIQRLTNGSQKKTTQVNSHHIRCDHPGDMHHRDDLHDIAGSDQIAGFVLPMIYPVRSDLTTLRIFTSQM